MEFNSLVDCANVEIQVYLQDLEAKRGKFDYYGYIKTNPAMKNGFEEMDCKVVLPDLNTRRVRYSTDADEVLCREITDKILFYCKDVIKEQPCSRIIVSKNGTTEIDIGR